MINSFFLNFNGRIHEGSKVVTLCCEGVKEKVGVTLDGTPEDVLNRFVEYRKQLIQSSRESRCDSYTKSCLSCANYQLGKWESDGLIHYINLSMYPSPCQCKCFYCGVHGSESEKFDKEKHAQYYEKLFEIIELARKKGLISNSATWQISCEEITIHPYIDRIFDLVKNERAVFYTNCFIYNEKIAENLKSNPYSAINLSIDCGTPETWYKIKGVNNFVKVKENLIKYRNSSVRAGQITLKYILLPGKNDNDKDYIGVIELMKLLEVKHLTISRDTRKKYKRNHPDRKKLIESAASLAALLHLAERTFDMFTFAPKEREEV